RGGARLGYRPFHVRTDTGVTFEVTLDVRARLGARDAQHLPEAEVALAIRQPEVDGLRDAPVLGGHARRRHAEDLGGGALVDVLARPESIQERRVLRERREDAQLDLRKVWRHPRRPTLR